MKLPLLIARRYLFAKKSHNVINIISAISATGMALGTAALVIILSVYNGFSDFVSKSVSVIESDLLVEASGSKVFRPDDAQVSWLRDLPEVERVCEVLEENVFINYEGNNGVAKAKGVDSLYQVYTPVRDKMVDGQFALSKGDIRQVAVGIGFAYKMGINPRLIAPVELYFPDRNKKISISNPAASLRSQKVWPSGLFSITTDTDNTLMIVQLDVMRDLLGYSKEVSALELTLKEGADTKLLAEKIGQKIGSGFEVKDRYRQNEALYKMMRTEKMVVYLVLIFIVIVIALNIFGSLTMLMIEKEDDIATLSSMGARARLIRRTFVLEGWMITLLGMAVGLILGLAAVLAQQEFGFVKMPGEFALMNYPVIIDWMDIIITAVSVAAIGYLIAMIPARKAIRQ